MDGITRIRQDRKPRVRKMRRQLLGSGLIIFPCFASFRFVDMFSSKIEVLMGVRNSKSGSKTDRMVSTLEEMQVSNGTGPGVRRSKRPLFATLCLLAAHVANVPWKPPLLYVIRSKWQSRFSSVTMSR